jgi:PAS domain S-box-containing protein
MPDPSKIIQILEGLEDPKFKEQIELLLAELENRHEELSNQQEELRQQQEELSTIRHELESSHKKYYDLYDLAPIGYLTFDANGILLEINRAGSELLGTKPQLVKGQSILSYIDEHHRNCFYQHRTSVIQSGDQQSCELRLVKKDGAHAFVHVQSKRVLSDGHTNVFSAFVDITRRKQAEHQLASQTELLKAIFDTIPVLLVVWDPQLQRFTLNRHAESVLGWTTADANDGDFMRKVYPDESYRPKVIEYMQSLRSGWHEWIGTTKGGNQAPIDWANIRLSDDTMVGIGVDLRERKRAEQALRESESLYRAMAQNFPEGAIYVFDHDLRYRIADGQALQATGFTREGLEGKTIWESTDEETWKILEQRYPRVLDGESLHFETPLKGRIFSSDYVPIHGENGRVIAGMVVSQDITERKRVEAALRISEEKFAKAFSNNPAAVALTRFEDGLFLDVNHTWEKLMGYSRNEVIGQSARKLPIWPTADAAKRFVQELQDKGSLHGWEQEFLKRSGETFFAVLSAQVLTIQGEKAILSTIVDITERRQMEAAVRESRDQFQTMGETVPYGVWLCEPDGGVRYSSQSFLDLLNMTQEEQQQFGWTKRLVPEDVAPMMKKWLGCCAAGAPWEHEHRIIDRHGKIHTILSKGLPVRDTSGKITCWTGVNLDITARKKVEQSLKESEQQLAKELDAARKLQKVSSLLIQTDKVELLYEKLLDTAMEILEADFASVQILHQGGKHKDQLQLIGNRGFSDNAAQFWEYVNTESESTCGIALRTLKRVISSNIDECPFMAGSRDREIYLQSGIHAVQTTPLISRSGKLIGMLSTHWRKPYEPTESDLRSMDVLARQAADLIDRTQAEEKLVYLNDTLEQQVAERTGLAEARSKKLQALAVELIEAEERERRQFAHLLHEDLQQMLAAARMHLQSFPNFPNEPLLKYVGQILEESITKTRSLSHELSPAVLHHSGLVHGLKWLIGQMKERFGFRVLLQADGAPVVESSALKLFAFRAVQELLFNTIKHAGVKQACVTLTGRDHHMVVTVSDRGCGFEIEDFSKGAKKPGFGLLSIIERADYIGGSFKIETAPGEGCRFILTVPLDAIDPSAKQVPLANEDNHLVMSGAVASTNETRILFVDDHRIMRQGLIKLMTGQPGIHMIGEAENGAEALELARHIRPDVIIMDISMPKMDGIEATRRIKAELPCARIIGLTMHDDDHLIGAMQEAGAEVVFKKDISAAEMVKAIYGDRSISPVSG